MQDKPAQRTPQARLQDQIDENLKRVYNEALEEKVPDRLLALLEALRQKDEGR